MTLFPRLRPNDLTRALEELTSSGLEQRRQRLYDDPPPPYSSGETTAFPSLDGADESSEEDKYFVKTQPYHQYLSEIIAESKKIRQEETGNPGSGIICHRDEAYDRVRQRWEDEGVWNSNWNELASGHWRHEEDPEFTASRPRSRFAYEVAREQDRLSQERTHTRTASEINDLATNNVRKRWQKRHLWDEIWADLPGENWKHERLRSRSQERDMMDIRQRERGERKRGHHQPSSFSFGPSANNGDSNNIAQEQLSEASPLLSLVSPTRHFLPTSIKKIQGDLLPRLEIVLKSNEPNLPNSRVSTRRRTRQKFGELHETVPAQKSISRASKRTDGEVIGRQWRESEPRRGSGREAGVSREKRPLLEKPDIRSILKAEQSSSLRRSPRIAEQLERKQKEPPNALGNPSGSRSKNAQQSKGKLAVAINFAEGKIIKKPRKRRKK